MPLRGVSTLLLRSLVPLLVATLPGPVFAQGSAATSTTARPNFLVILSDDQNIDVAPTIYELAGLITPPEVDGWSLVPLLDAARVQASAALPWRAELLIEGWFADAALKLGWAPYVAVHTGRHVYVETEGDRPELYDLSTDPYQQHNQMGNPDYKTIATDLKSRLKRLLPASAALPQR